MKNINKKVSDRRDIWKAILNSKGKKEMDKVIDGLNSCDVLWLMDTINKLPIRSKQYLTIEKKFDKV